VKLLIIMIFAVFSASISAQEPPATQPFVLPGSWLRAIDQYQCLQETIATLPISDEAQRAVKDLTSAKITELKAGLANFEKTGDGSPPLDLEENLRIIEAAYGAKKLESDRDAIVSLLYSPRYHARRVLGVIRIARQSEIAMFPNDHAIPDAILKCTAQLEDLWPRLPADHSRASARDGIAAFELLLKDWTRIADTLSKDDRSNFTLVTIDALRGEANVLKSPPPIPPKR
jgi:hypothetical protein